MMDKLKIIERICSKKDYLQKKIVREKNFVLRIMTH